MITFTKEQLIARINQVTAINNYRISRDPSADGLAMDNELLAIALASLEAEAVAYIIQDSDARSRGEKGILRYFANISDEDINEYEITVTPLYSAPPAPVVPAELHPDTQELVTDFCTALAEKLYKAQLKYGYDADWKQDGWPTQCQAHFHQHIAKGDPRDVAAYCAFMWYHGWKTEPAPVSVPDDEQGKPHPVMAVKGELGFLDHFDRIISERDEDIDIGQLGSRNYEALMLAALDVFRDAMLQGAEPVTTANKLPANVIDALEKALEAMSFMGDTLNAMDAVCEEDVEYVTPAFDAVRKVLEGNSPAIPDGWVACSERMPEKLIPVMVMYADGEMWSAIWTGTKWDDGTEFPDPHAVTHWQEMPAAPQQEA